MRLLKKLLVLLLAAALMAGTLSVGETRASAIYGNASEWAKPEIEDAYANGLIPARLLGRDLVLAATREELCEVAVKLYESLAGSEAEPAFPNPFTDTDNPEILKAYALGITSGVSASSFAPGAATNREQVATMFSRTLRALYPQGDFTTSLTEAYDDQSLISSWALEHVLYMTDIGLLKGAAGKFMPRPTTPAETASGYGMTKREEAIAISIRAYNTFEGREAGGLGDRELFIGSLIDTSRPRFVLSSPGNIGSFLDNGDIYVDSRTFRPTYSPKILLYAVSGYGSSGSPTYSANPYDSLVPRSGGGIASFRIGLDAATRSSAKSIVWQIGRAPFNGKPVGPISLATGNLLASGSLAPTATSFQVDFSGLDLPEAGTATVYVRAFPIGSSGGSIGDAGSGLPVLYGDPPVQPAAPSGTFFNLTSSTFTLIKLAPTLKAAWRQGAVTYTGEYPNNFGTATEVGINPVYGTGYSFLPGNLPSDAQELRFQVSSMPFEGTGNDAWRQVPGLLYEESHFPGDPAYKALTDPYALGIRLDFSKWAPSLTKLDGDTIPYYVRAVVFTPGDVYTAMNASYTNTITVGYGTASEFTYYKEVEVDAPIPVVRKVEYVHPRFELPEWQYRYEVFSQPTYSDVFPFYLGSNRNDPYPDMPVGTKLDFTPQPEDKSWWEEAWDAISGFFSDLASLGAKLVNWVSTAYADLKSGLIDLAANSLPLPESWKGPLKKALAGMVDYGLVAVGIPPTLPNFDELTSMGTEYLAAVALEQAGIPDVYLSSGTVADQLEQGIEDLAASSTRKAGPNPMGYDFIKHDPDYLYQPARLLITVKNTSSRRTEPGWLQGTAMHYMTESERMAPGSSSLYAKFGTPWFQLYKPVHGLFVPPLQPGQELVIPVFLEPYADIKMPGTGTTVTYNDFVHIYNLEDFSFDFIIRYDLPSPEAHAMASGQHEGQGIYVYAQEQNRISLTLKSYQNWSSN